MLGQDRADPPDRLDQPSAMDPALMAPVSSMTIPAQTSGPTRSAMPVSARISAWCSASAT